MSPTSARILFHRVLGTAPLCALLFTIFSFPVWAQEFSASKNLSNTTISADPPKIVVGQSGNVYAIWSEFLDLSNTDIFFTYSLDGGENFATPKNISNTPTHSDIQISNNSFIALDDQENVYVVWGEAVAPPFNGEFFFTTSTDGGNTFSIPKNISNTEGGSFFGQFSVDATGNIYFLWRDSTNLFTRSTDGGNTFSVPIPLPPHPIPFRTWLRMIWGISLLFGQGVLRCLPMT